MSTTGRVWATFERLIATTDEPLQVDIFARNPSRAFSGGHGFRERDEELEHEFRPGVMLPVQRPSPRDETTRSGLTVRAQSA